MADPRQICFDILGKLRIPDPENEGEFKTVVYQGTSQQFANYRTGLKKPRQVREYVIQTPSNTAGQIQQRSFMSQAITAWQTADQTEKNRALNIAKTRMLPLYHAYLSLKINELIIESENDMWQDAYPVGSIYINTTAADPNTFMGFGTWENFAAGRVLVGLNDGVAPFDTLGDTGGEETHTLTESEMPSHTHTQNAHTHTLTNGTNVMRNAGSGNIISGFGGVAASTLSNANTTAVNQNTGGGNPHNNLQPYIVVSIWHRTA